MTLGDLLIAHGSVFILPLAVIEGPVVTVLVGFLSEQGYLDWYWALSLVVCGDVIGDIVYYWVGRTGGTRLVRLGHWLGMRRIVSPELQHKLIRNTTKMLLIGKWTHSIGGLVLIGSGMLRLPLLRFVLVNLLATLPKSAALFGFGYFAGNTSPLFERHAVLGTLLLCGMGVAAVMLVLRGANGIWAGRTVR
jgi:membrane protein DedA with SNARE-associated domain